MSPYRTKQRTSSEPRTHNSQSPAVTNTGLSAEYARPENAGLQNHPKMHVLEYNYEEPHTHAYWTPPV